MQVFIPTDVAKHAGVSQSTVSRAFSAGSKAAIDFLIAAHFLCPFWSSGTPVCKLPLYLFDRALPMFWLPSVTRTMRLAVS